MKMLIYYMKNMGLAPTRTFNYYSMKILLIIMFLTFSLTAWAQDGENLKKIESARIALITERLELTPEQAEKFWPLYREYVAKRQGLRREFLDARKAVDEKDMTEV